MKIKLITQTFILFFIFLFNNSLLGQITLANTNGNWISFKPNTPPPSGWQTSYSQVNWENTTTGTQNNWQECLHNPSYGLPKPTCNGNQGLTQNYIWGTDSRSTSYFKYFHSIPNDSTYKHFIKVAADNELILWVNGTQVLHLFNWQIDSLMDITQHLNSDTTNIITAQVTNVSGPYFFIAQLSKEKNNLSISFNESLNLEKPTVNLTPNPTSSSFKVLHLKNEELTFEQVEIMDYTGKVIQTYNNINSNHEYNLSEYSKGIYLIRVKVGNEYQQMKLILK